MRSRWTLRARRKSVKSVYGGGLSRAAFWGGLDARSPARTYMYVDMCVHAEEAAHKTNQRTKA